MNLKKKKLRRNYGKKILSDSKGEEPNIPYLVWDTKFHTVFL